MTDEGDVGREQDPDLLAHSRWLDEIALQIESQLQEAEASKKPRIEVDPEQVAPGALDELLSERHVTQLYGHSPQDRIQHAAAKTAEASADGAKIDVYLRAVVALVVLLFMGYQLAKANSIFLAYGNARGWDIPGSVMQFWLAATVVEVISVVIIIANYLFPRPDRDETENDSSITDALRRLVGRDSARF